MVKWKNPLCLVVVCLPPSLLPCQAEEPGSVKTVRQFHFTAWPDFGVPLNGGPLLKFLLQVRKHHEYSNPKPLLVHCRCVDVSVCVRACVCACVRACACVCVPVCAVFQLPLPSPSAGVGRTGTFIGLDVELQRANREGVVDPYNFVLHMRDQRNLMVQTEVGSGQYTRGGGQQWWWWGATVGSGCEMHVMVTN